VNLNDFFTRLDGELRAEGMACGPDVWLRVFQLPLVKQLMQKDANQVQLEEIRYLMLWLRPLFCRNPEEQARFSFLYEQCLTAKPASAAADNRIVSAQQAIYHTVRDNAKKVSIYWWCGGALVLALILAVLFVTPPDVPPQSNLPRPPNEDIKKTGPDAVTADPAANRPAIAIIEHIAPRPQPEPDDPEIPWPIITLLYLTPWLVVAWLFSKQYFRKLQFNRAPTCGDALFNKLSFDRNLTPIWGGGQAERSLRDLRSARLVPTRRLNVAATAEATARNGDYFLPVYRKRRSPPEHVLLVRSLHRNDQQAGLAEELAARFQSLGLQAHVYRFRDDPRWLVHWESDDGSYLQLDQLRSKYETARLLIISETGILFHPYSGEAYPWLTELSAWQDKVWLHPHDARSAHADLLAQQNILLLPLSRDSLPQLVSHLTAVQPVKLIAQPAHRLALPDIIAAQPEDWLGERPPHGIELSELQWQLEHFLGTYGMRLLRAAAVYPKPNWNLTKALDYLLFGHLDRADPPVRREQRLSRLSGLPWLKHSFIPNWLREQLLLNCAADERQHIVKAWQTLFDQLTKRERRGSLHLEISTPSRRQIKLQLREWQSMQQSDAINDPIFANILLGGKFGLLDFHLPRALAKLLPFAQQTLILRPLQLVLLGAALLGSWGLHHYGAQGYLALQQYRIAQDNARWQVSLHYQSTTQALAEALSNTLQTARFSATVQSDAIESDDKTNVIRYAVGGKKAAERVARSLAWLTYGLEAEPIETTRLPAGFLQVQLNQTYQPGVGFSDELRYQTKEKPYISERIRDVESGNNVCNTAGQADSYVFALSWLPAFCEMKPEKFECQTADPNVYQAKHFTLLGLWPNKKSCGVNYGYCGEIKVAKQNFCEYPEINLDSISRAAIAKVMPGAIEGSCLERHQWY